MDPGSTSDDGRTANTGPMEGGGRSSPAAHIDPSLSGVFDALSSSRSRHVLYALTDDDEGSLAFDDLVVAVGVRESSGSAGSDDDRSAIRSSLYHAHLPKLADLDLIAPDWDDGEVTLTAKRDRVEPYLSLSRRVDAP